MNNIEREDIQIIARHSNWPKKSIETTLKKEIYNDKASWFKFLRIFFISLGIGFTTAGIIFFFAYNWEDLHKFVKIGIIEGLIVVLTLIVLFTKISLDIKNILLTGASVLVGALFAVFGQVYQTGANAYDFFLGWVMFISIWVLISNFAPLWLIFITLINTTLVLYTQQVAHDWSEIDVFTILFLINVFFAASFLIAKKINPKVNAPSWLTNIIALGAITFSTIGIAIGIIDAPQRSLSLLLLIALSLLVYTFATLYGFKQKSSFYLSIISFSIIIILSALFLKLSSEAGMFFFVSLFVIGSVTLVIKSLINLQKEWTK